MSEQPPITVEQLRAALQTLDQESKQEGLVEEAIRNFELLSPMPLVPEPPPHFVPAPHKKLEELRKFEKKALELVDAYTALHQDAVLGLASHLPRPYLQSMLDLIASSAAKARRDAEELPADPTLEPSKGGRPQSVKAQIVARLCAQYFRQLTGRKPTITVNSIAEDSKASGPFLDFVGDIFRALHIRPRPEHFARQSIRWLKVQD